MEKCLNCCELYPITIKQGATFQRVVKYVDQYDNPIDLTDYTAALQIKLTYTDTATPLVSLTDGNGLTIDPLNGLITIEIDFTDTENLPAPWEGVYDLLITHDTLAQRILQGTVSITPRVTE